MRNDLNLIFAPASKNSDPYSLEVMLYDTKNGFKIAVILQNMMISQAVYSKLFRLSSDEANATSVFNELSTRLTEFRDFYEYNELSSVELQRRITELLDNV